MPSRLPTCLQVDPRFVPQALRTGFTISVEAGNESGEVDRGRDGTAKNETRKSVTEWENLKIENPGENQNKQCDDSQREH
jgi:hypothetical protein